MKAASVALLMAMSALGPAATVLATDVVLSAADCEAVFSAAGAKLAAHDARFSTKTSYPDSSTGSTWTTVAATNWESGFYPGTLWLMYEHTGNASWETKARNWTAGIESQKTDSSTHDIGFRIYDSFGQGYRLDPAGNASYQGVLLTAANTLSKRFDPDVGCTRSWGAITDTSSFQVIIDNMMNIELLAWAGNNGGTSAVNGWSLTNMAISHADKTLANHVRPNGSTYHLVNYNQTNGTVISKSSSQGMGTETTWSRGQAWAIYGFTMMYRETGLTRYRDAAIKTADYWLNNIPADYVPMDDFDRTTLTGTLYTKDASAAAIAASAFVELGSLVPDPSLRDKYWNAAGYTLRSLTSSPYLSTTVDRAGLLEYERRNYSDPTTNNTSYIWGDYYLLEAVQRYETLVAPEPAGLLTLLAVVPLAALRQPSRRFRGVAQAPGGTAVSFKP